MVILILLLTICDATFTLHIIANGGLEVNPIMNYFLEMGVWQFLVAKFLLTWPGLYILHKYKHITISKIGLVLLLITYSVLVAYEIALIVQ